MPVIETKEACDSVHADMRSQVVAFFEMAMQTYWIAIIFNGFHAAKAMWHENCETGRCVEMG